MPHLTNAEIGHLRVAIAVLREKYEDYPETFNREEEESLLIAEEILSNENTHAGY